MVWFGVAEAHPPTQLPCEEIAARLADEPLPTPPATPTYWWLEPNACPEGKLGGPVPPAAREVWCVDVKGERHGRATQLDGELQVLRETRFDHGDEVGPRIDWNPRTRKVVAISEYLADLPHGRSVEWSATGVLVAWRKRGYEDGPTYRLGLRGDVQFVQFWSNGARLTRSCVWRDGKLAIDTP